VINEKKKRGEKPRQYHRHVAKDGLANIRSSALCRACSGKNAEGTIDFNLPRGVVVGVASGQVRLQGKVNNATQSLQESYLETTKSGASVERLPKWGSKDLRRSTQRLNGSNNTHGGISTTIRGAPRLETTTVVLERRRRLRTTTMKQKWPKKAPYILSSLIGSHKNGNFFLTNEKRTRRSSHPRSPTRTKDLFTRRMGTHRGGTERWRETKSASPEKIRRSATASSLNQDGGGHHQAVKEGFSIQESEVHITKIAGCWPEGMKKANLDELDAKQFIRRRNSKGGAVRESAPSRYKEGFSGTRHRPGRSGRFTKRTRYSNRRARHRLDATQQLLRGGLGVGVGGGGCGFGWKEDGTRPSGGRQSPFYV